MPAKDVFAVRLKETSENHATKKRYCGASYGSFEKHGANGYPCGISHGRLRTMNREENNLRISLRKTPRNKPF